MGQKLNMKENFQKISYTPTQEGEAKKPKAKATRHRNAGHGWEREIIDDFKAIGFHDDLTSARAENRTRDAQKIDITYKNEHIHGRFPYNIQAKNVSRTLSYHDVYKEIVKVEGIMNVICHKLTTGTVTKQKIDKATGTFKGESKRRFVQKGKYAILAYEDFVSLAGKIRQLEAELAELKKH